MLPMIADHLSIQASLRLQSTSGEAATAHNGTGIDIGEATGPILVTVDAPVASSGDTIDFTVEHSYDNSTFVAVGSDALVNPDSGEAATFTQVTAAVAVFQTRALKRDRLRRYVRVVATTAGSSISVSFAAYVLFAKKYDS